MFRDTNGDVGCFKEACPHRGASLFFGRNEEAGLRCVYHGWKFDTTGACVDMPSEPAESNFKNKVRVKAYPARDVNHMVWVYMGPREVPPPFPMFEVNTLPPENVRAARDHDGRVQLVPEPRGRHRLQPPRLPALTPRRLPLAPLRRGAEGRLEARPVLHGVERQDAAPGRAHHRLRCVLQRRRNWDDEFGEAPRRQHAIRVAPHQPVHLPLPHHDHGRQRRCPALVRAAGRRVGHADHAARQPHRALYFPDSSTPTPLEAPVGFVDRTSDPRTYFYTKANKHNDYKRDFEVERTQMVSGVPAIGNLQDRAMTELMSNEKGEVIYDRSHEHLGSLDIMCIAVRRQLLKAVKAFRDANTLPANVDDVRLDSVRPATVVLPEGANWVKTRRRSVARKAAAASPTRCARCTRPKRVRASSSPRSRSPANRGRPQANVKAPRSGPCSEVLFFRRRLPLLARLVPPRRSGTPCGCFRRMNDGRTRIV